MRAFWLWLKREWQLALADDWQPVIHEAFTKDDARCEALRLKQEKARQFMHRAGIKTLLNGKPAWRRINVMAAPTDPAKVIPMRRKK